MVLTAELKAAYNFLKVTVHYLEDNEKQELLIEDSGLDNGWGFIREDDRIWSCKNIVFNT